MSYRVHDSVWVGGAFMGGHALLPGAFNPIGSAHALMRVSELAAAATTTMPISAHAMAVMLFARRTGRSGSFTAVGVDRLAPR